MISVLFVLSLSIVVGVATSRGSLSPVIGAYYTAASLVTFAVYARDKSAAVTGRWRTPESTLHLFSLIGGWPGGMVAQQLLHHKTRKSSFRVIFFVTVVLNCTALFYLSHTLPMRVALELP